MTRAGLSVLVALALIAPSVARLVGRGPSPSDQNPSADRFVEPAKCRPEPGERAAYLVAAVGLPALIFAVAAVGARVVRPSPDNPAQFSPIDLGWLGLAVGVAAVGLGRDGWFHLRSNGFFRHPALSGLVVVLVPAFFLKGGRGTRALAGAVGLTAIGATALMRVLGEGDPYTLHNHFEPVHHAVVQVGLGKTALVDLASQYGLYPHLVAPIVGAMGGGIVAFTVAMAALVAAAALAVRGAIGRLVDSPVVAVVGLLATIGGGSVLLFEPGVGDLYYQYNPIRTLFPSLSLWLAARYATRPSRSGHVFTMATLALGPLWNLDSGLPAMAAWLAMLGYRELARGRGWRAIGRAVGQVAVGVGAMAAAGLGYAAFALLRSGRLPDLAATAAYQRFFYEAGYYMLPMPAVGGWWAVALVYLAALGLAATALVRGRAGPTAAMAVHLAVLGIGLFAYYQGRSHPRVLTLAWWPAFVLMTLALDRLVADRGRPGRVARLGWIVALTWTLGGSAVGLVAEAGAIRDWLGAHLVSALGPARSPVAADLAAIRDRLGAGDRLLIVSRNESLLSARLGVRSAWRSSLIEAVLIDDFRAIAARADRGEFTHVYLDRDLLAPPFDASLGPPELARAVNRGETVATTGRGRLIRIAPGSAPTPLLGDDPGLFASGYEAGRVAGSLPGPPVAIDGPYTIEAVFFPDPVQAPAATLIGDHPGRLGPSAGWTLQQWGDDRSRFALLAGDGERYRILAEVRTEAGRWNGLAIAVGPDRATAYLDGRPVDVRAIPDASAVAPSGAPVLVGDWPGRDRPFSGRVAEVRVSRGAIGAETARSRWESIRDRLPAFYSDTPRVVSPASREVDPTTAWPIPTPIATATKPAAALPPR